VAPAITAPAQPVAGSASGAPAAGTTVGASVAGRAQRAAAAAQAQARAQAHAAATSITATSVAAPPAPPGPPTPGRLYGGTQTGADSRRTRPLPRLRIGSHLASDAALSLMNLSTPGTGLVLGRDSDKSSVMLRLFRPEPTRVTLVGGPWVCQLLMLRALALGARIAILTTAPEWWEGFGEWATGSKDRVVVLPVDRTVNASGSSQAPVLMLYDAGLLGPSVQPSLGPWQTQLTVLRQLTAYGQPAVQESNLVVTQRLTVAEAEVANAALRLGERTSYLLQVLNEDMVALLGGVGGGERYVWVTPTRVEQEQIGAPRR
jgi:hypothetical protein